jgi:MoxR-like ATPase
MLILMSQAWKAQEPVLFVGDTGCGKTTAAHLFVRLKNYKNKILINCFRIVRCP